jgi:hypothetical protein
MDGIMFPNLPSTSLMMKAGCHKPSLKQKVMCLSDKTIVVGYFSWDDLPRMDVMETPVERFRDVCFGQPAPVVR